MRSFFITTIVTSILVVSFSSNAFASKIELIPTKTQLWVNESTYILLSVFDDTGKPLVNPKILTKIDPTYMGTIGKFNSCTSTEWQDVCKNVDGAINAPGAYVAKFTASDKTGNAKINVYVDSTSYSVDLTVWAQSTQTPEVKIASAVSTDSAPISNVVKAEVDSVQAWSNSQGQLLLVLTLVLLPVLLFVRRKV